MQYLVLSLQQSFYHTKLVLGKLFQLLILFQILFLLNQYLDSLDSIFYIFIQILVSQLKFVHLEQLKLFQIYFFILYHLDSFRIILLQFIL